MAIGSTATIHDCSSVPVDRLTIDGENLDRRGHQERPVDRASSPPRICPASPALRGRDGWPASRGDEWPATSSRSRLRSRKTATQFAPQHLLRVSLRSRTGCGYIHDKESIKEQGGTDRPYPSPSRPSLAPLDGLQRSEPSNMRSYSPAGL